MDVPEVYGGFGVKDFRYNVIITEELAYANSSRLNFAVHTDVRVPYLIHYGNEEQKQRWQPKSVTGECITAIAISEPNTGSEGRAHNSHQERSGQLCAQRAKNLYHQWHSFRFGDRGRQNLYDLGA